MCFIDNFPSLSSSLYQNKIFPPDFGQIFIFHPVEGIDAAPHAFSERVVGN